MSARLPWPQVSEAIARLLGLHFSAGRQADLRRGIDAAAAALDLRPEFLVQRLLEGRLDEAATHALADHLTVGETYFFRAPECVEALRRNILPALIGARAASRRLRFWSAGCCTGEEPYTLAMLLRELLPDIDSWHVSILATDLNPRFLHKAEQGIYAEWSFRATPSAARAKYFRSLGDGRHAIDDTLRAMVNFQPLNLCRDVYPSIDTGTNAMDLILCRNVLMYFDEEQARRAVSRLHAALQHDGWLSVAPCEVSSSLFSAFVPVRFADAIFYRRAVVQADAGQVPVVAPPHTADAARSDRIRSRPRGVAATVQGQGSSNPSGLARSRAAAPVPVPAENPLGHQAKALADQGRLTEARDLCERWIAEQKLDAAAHYLHALVAMELGDTVAAAGSLRHCAYLAPDAPMVHFALGNLERTHGHHARALRLYRYTREVIADLPPDAAIAYSDGLNAAQLGALVHDLISTEELHARAA